jgi:hypothetical protein
MRGDRLCDEAHLAVAHHESQLLCAMPVHQPRRLLCPHAYALSAASGNCARAQRAGTHCRPSYDPGPPPLQALASPTEPAMLLPPQRRVLR